MVAKNRQGKQGEASLGSCSQRFLFSSALLFLKAEDTAFTAFRGHCFSLYGSQESEEEGTESEQDKAPEDLVLVTYILQIVPTLCPRCRQKSQRVTSGGHFTRKLQQGQRCVPPFLLQPGPRGKEACSSLCHRRSGLHSCWGVGRARPQYNAQR